MTTSGPITHSTDPHDTTIAQTAELIAQLLREQTAVKQKLDTARTQLTQLMRDHQLTYVTTTNGKQTVTLTIQPGRRKLDQQKLAEQQPDIYNAIAEQTVRLAKLDAYAHIHHTNPHQLLDTYAPRGDNYLVARET